MIAHLIAQRWWLVCSLAAAMTVLPPFLSFGPAELAGLAMADDDDDDDGDDDDGGGGGRGGYSSGGGGPGYLGDGRQLRSVRPGNLLRGIRRALTGQPARRSQARAAPAVQLASRVEDEIVAAGIDEAQAAELVSLGYAVLEREDIGLLGSSLVKLRIPDGTTLETARDQVRALAGTSQVDYNHFYRPEQGAGGCSGPHCAAPQLVGWPTGAERLSCAAGVRIGLVDTGINPDHAAFEGVSLEVIRVGDDELAASSQQHGTAVAALLAGSAESRTPGLLPAATYVAIDAFHRASPSDDRADVFTLVRAIDAASGRDVAVLNLSLAGPANDVLQRAVTAVAESTVVVAAVGNAGPSAEAAFPAAYAGVIGVTAVDRGKRVYRRAGRGEHVDVAAPGVEVWTAASVSGGRPKTGTSFAAPFATAAAAALLAADPMLTPAEVKERIRNTAEDLGDPGRDPVFGWGLLDAQGLCAQPHLQPAASIDP